MSENLANMNYNAYLGSNAWRNKRAEALDHYGHRCDECGKTERLEVHHVNRPPFGEEKMEDLQILCVSCHRSKPRENFTDRVRFMIDVTPQLQTNIYRYLLEKRGRMPLSAWVRGLMNGTEKPLPKEYR